MTQPIFAVRGNSLDAYYAAMGEKANLVYKTASKPALVSSSGLTGAFGAQVIDVSNPTFSGYRGIAYNGKNVQSLSTGNPISVIIRIIPKFNGAPAQAMGIWSFATSASASCSMMALNWDTSGKLLLNAVLINGNQYLGALTTNTVSATSNTALEIQLSWNGLSSGNIGISVNGVFLENITSPQNFSFDSDQITDIMLGTGNASLSNVQNNFYIDEFLVFNVALPTTYTARTAYYTSLILQPLASTDPGVTNVKSGVSYNFQGNALSGTLLSTDPGVANVLGGVSYEINSVPKTGTAIVPSGSDVRYGVQVLGGTGTLQVPAASDVRDGVFVDAGTGTAFIPAPADVRLGTPVDATVGTLTVGNYYAGFRGGEPTGPEVCLVWGYVKDITGVPVANAKVTFTLTTVKKNEYMEASSHILAPSSVTAVTDAGGYFQQQLVQNSQFEGLDTSYVVTIESAQGVINKLGTGQPINIVVPSANDANITTLLTAL